jgi:hypothetical protein
MNIFAFFCNFATKNSIRYEKVMGIISIYAVVDGLPGVARRPLCKGDERVHEKELPCEDGQ